MSEPLSEAVLEFEAAPSASSNLERATIDRVLGLLEQGSLDDATTVLDDALHEDEGGLALRALRAKLDYLAGHFSSAALRYSTLAAEAEDTPALRVDEALCLLRAERHDDAFAVLFALLTRGVQSPRLWGYLGVALEQRGQYQEAATAYLAGGHSDAAQRMRRRKLDSMLAREGAARLDADELFSGAPPRRASEPAPATRGVESLRDANLRTSPPAHLDAPGLTDVPRSLSGHPAETTAQRRAPRTLLDVTLATLLVVPGDEPWSRHDSGLVCAQAHADRPIYYDTRAFLARSHPGLAAAPHLGGSKGFTKAEAGRLVLAPRGAGETLHLLDLAGEALVVHDRYVVAFDGIDGVTGPVRHDAPWPLEMLEFEGHGMVVLGLHEEFLTYDVRSDDLFELRASNLIGWAGRLQVALDDEPGPTATRRVRFSGDGTVFLLTRPHATTSSIMPHHAGGR